MKQTIILSLMMAVAAISYTMLPTYKVADAKGTERAGESVRDVKCRAIVENYPEAHLTIAYKHCE